jgi:hypothetical protein
MRKGGFTESRRSIEQDMVKGFTPLSGGGDEEFQLVHHLFLSHELIRFSGAEAFLILPFLLHTEGRENVIIEFVKIHHLFSESVKKIRAYQ